MIKTYDFYNDKNIFIDDVNDDIILNIKDNTNIVINYFNIINDKKNINVIINAFNNTDLTLLISYITYEEINLNIKYVINGDNNRCNIKLKSISEKKGLSNIKICSEVLSDTFDNELNESISIITNNELKNVVIPDLLIGTSNVIANHSTAIGKLDKNELNYLMAKGLSKTSSQKLIENGYLTSNLRVDNDKIVKINEILLNRR